MPYDKTEEFEDQTEKMYSDLKVAISDAQAEMVIALARAISGAFKKQDFICKTNNLNTKMFWLYPSANGQRGAGQNPAL